MGTLGDSAPPEIATLWRGEVAVFGDPEQLGHFQPKSICEGSHSKQARVAGSTLDVGDVGPVQTGFVTQICLGQVQLTSELANGVSETAAQGRGVASERTDVR